MGAAAAVAATGAPGWGRLGCTLSAATAPTGCFSSSLTATTGWLRLLPPWRLLEANQRVSVMSAIFLAVLWKPAAATWLRMSAGSVLRKCVLKSMLSGSPVAAGPA